MSSTPRFWRFRTVLGIVFYLTGLTTSLHAAVGELDPSFGNMGKVTTVFAGGSSGAEDLAIQPDGKIVTVGYSSTPEGRPVFTIARYNSTGLLDGSFGGTGKVITVLGEYDHARGVAVQNDGKILVVGLSSVSGAAHLALVRYTAQGELDVNFGNQGKVLTPGLNGAAILAKSVVVQNDGRILVGGSMSTPSGGSKIIVRRYSADGVPETNFGSGGIASMDIGERDVGGSVLLQPDGKIVVAGSTFTANRSRIVVIRFTDTGLPDQSFGTGGRELTEVGPGNAYGNDAALQPNGAIVVAGYTHANEKYDFAIVRYYFNGKLDRNFGTEGKVITDFGSAWDQGEAVALQDDGSIVVAGQVGAGPSFPTNRSFAVARYTSAGILDPSFNGTGVTKTVIGLNDYAHGVAIQSDTKIVAAGTTSNTTSDFALSRYIADETTLPPTLISPASGSVNNFNLSIAYDLPEPASEVTLTFTNGATDYEITLAAFARLKGSHGFVIPAGDPTNSPLVATGPQIPSGIYTVTLSYRDIAGNPPAQAVASTGVVIDWAPPEVSAPDTIEAVATDSSGAVVTFEVTATDNLDPQPNLVVTPPSGSTFPVGLTLVEATAKDVAGNQGGRLFYVIVRRTAVSCVTGQPVPGAGEPDGVPAGSTWQSIGVPSLLGSGEEVGFSGRIRTPAGSKQGIISLSDGKAKMLLQIGDSARGPTGDPANGAKFASFREPVWGDVSSFAVAAKIAGRGINSSNDDGVWVRHASGTISEVAREGVLAQETNGARFKAFTSILMTSLSRLFLHAKLRGPKISALNDDSLWEWTATAGLKLVQQEGFPVRYPGGPAEPVRSIEALVAVPKSPGHGRYSEDHISVRYLFSNNVRRILSLNSGGPEIELSSGTPITEGITPIDFGTPCFKSSANFSTLARLQPGGLITDRNNLAIIRKDGLVAQQAMPAPDSGGAVFASLNAPVTEADADGDQTDAFIASLSGESITRQNDEGIWVHREYLPNLSLVAREGAEPVGAPGTLFQTFTSLAVMDHHGIAFTAKLKSDTERVAKSNDDGLWAVDSLGIHRLLLREGDVIDGKTVKSFTTLGTIAGSPAQRRSIRPGNQFIVSRAVFTDGSTGIITSNVP